MSNYWNYLIYFYAYNLKFKGISKFNPKFHFFFLFF